MRRSLRPAALPLLAALLAPLPALAQWSSDPAVNLTLAAEAGGNVQPKLVPTADGGFYVSWFGGAGFDVSLQRLSAGGVPQWAAGGVLVADRDESSTQDYGLALDAEGNALVAFGYPDAGGNLQAVANRVAPDGTLLWPAPGVYASHDADAAASPRIIGVGGGASVVAWTSFSTGDIVLQKLDANGAPQWGPDGVTLPLPTGTFFIADLQADADGNVVVSGSAQLSFQSRRLWAQKLAAADGAPLWGTDPVEVFNGSGGAMQFGYFPPFVMDGSGGAVFAWYVVSGASDATVRVQHVTAGGQQQFAQNGVIVAEGDGRQRYAPSGAYDAASGSIYVVWPEEKQVGTTRTFGVSAQRISAAGARQWGDLGAELVAMGGEQGSQVSAVLVGGEPVFAWSLGSAPGAMRLQAARLTSAGARVWPGTGIVPFKTAATSNGRLEGAVSADGFAAYVWEDGSGTGGGAIKAQNVNPDGTLGPTGTVAVEGGPPTSSLTLYPIAPNPAASSTAVRYALAEAGHVRVEVYDALGRRVAVLTDGEQGAGTYTAAWDATAQPGGVYVVRVRAGAATATQRVAVAR